MKGGEAVEGWGLGSKGAGSREVPVTTLPSHKDGVVQRAVRICR